MLNRNDMWKFGTLSVSPFDWLEASYFYYRPSDLRWEGNNVRGHYLDKGFNVKFIYRPKVDYLPNVAIGLDDFAGTGFFTREYIVATSQYNNLKITYGLGWGKFTGESSFENPLSFLSDGLIKRPTSSDNFGQGGNPSYDQWFRGNASYIGGIEYIAPKLKGVRLKVEYDPFNYFDFSANNRTDASNQIRKKESNINFGISYPFNEFLTVDASFIKGNTFNLSFNLSLAFNDTLNKKTKFNPNISKSNKSPSKQSFYEDLLFNLNNNGLFLQTASLDENELDISISTSQYRNAIRSSSYAAYISKQITDNNELEISKINVTHINAGVEINKISYVANYFDKDTNTPYELKIRNTDLQSGDREHYKLNEFRPNIDFPVIFSSTSPVIASHVGNPEKFYFGGVNLKNTTEIQFNRNLILSSELIQPLFSNFEDTISGPGSNMEHVRTDLVQYLKEDDISISRMQLDYIWSPYKNVYAKISGGIFEPMFGGIGGELLFKPFKSNFLIGFEGFYVKQRTFQQRFNFRKYGTFTGHINLGYLFNNGIETNISIGSYLAKDKGYTIDLGRRTNSGFKSGIYFTRTNVSAELFGEGSFDKGFYFQIPMEFFSNNYQGNYSTFKLSPLTRDGGAKLIHDKDLRGLIYNSTNSELIKQMDGFLN